jgi:hypothetical protein
MRKMPLLTLIAGLCLAADPRETSIVDREKAFASAWNQRDVTAMTGLVTDDFILISRTGQSADKNQFLATLTAGRLSKDAGSQVNDLKIRFYGTNTAIVTFVNNVNPTTIHTHVWVNLDTKGWRIASFHASNRSANPVK